MIWYAKNARVCDMVVLIRRVINIDAASEVCVSKVVIAARRCGGYNNSGGDIDVLWYA